MKYIKALYVLEGVGGCTNSYEDSTKIGVCIHKNLFTYIFGVKMEKRTKKIIHN